jgi:CrcB protein
VSLALAVLGAAVGAPARYLVDRAVQGLHDSVFPWGTLSVNVAGSFALGLIAALSPAPVQALLGAGFCGALTTYSTFSYETLRLAEDGADALAVANVLGSVLAGVVAAFAGVGLAVALGAAAPV